MGQRAGLTVFLLIVATTFLNGQTRIAQDCTLECGPIVGSTAYAGVAASRAEKQNARGFSSPETPMAPDPAGTPSLPGSQSYSHVIPILHLPGRNNLDLDLTLHYNSRVWDVDVVDSVATFNADRDFPSYGFRLDFGFLEYNSSFDEYILTESDGTKRALLNSPSAYDSNDGAFLHYDAVARMLRYRSGRMVQYELFPNNANLLRPIKIEDTNSNFISIAYRPSNPGDDQKISAITDTRGKVILFNYDASGKLSTITQNVAVSSMDPSGVHVYAAFTWGSLYGGGYVWFNFGTSFVGAPDPSVSLNVIVACAYANGTGYRFSYGDWGVVNRIDTLSADNPQITRSYRAFDFPAAAAGPLSDAPAYQHETLSRDGTNISTWTYSVSKAGIGAVTTEIITDPAGNTNTIGLNPDGTISSSVEHEFTSGKNLRAVAYTWKAIGSAKLPDIVTTTNDQGQSSSVQYFYDSYGNVTDLYEREFGGAQLRHTITAYSQNAGYINQHILNLPTQILIKDAGENVRSRTDLAYDQNSLIVVIGVAGHDDGIATTAGTPRGNLTAVTRYSNASAGSGPIARSFFYDSFGNLRTAQMDCCIQKVFNFSATTQYAAPDSVVRGPGIGPQFTLSFTYNADYGLMVTSSDENSQQTFYAYDVMFRPKTVTPPASNGTSVHSDLAYGDTGASPTVTASSTTNSAVIVRTFDGLRHLLRQDTKNGSTLLSSVTYGYNTLWQRTQVSNPFSPSDPVSNTTFTYDALWRSSSIAPPSGGSTNIQYAGRQIITTDPTGKQRANYADSLRRLIQVDEPGEANSVGAKATASIDIGGIKSVPRNGAQASANVNIGSGDGSGTDLHIDDPSEPCPPLPAQCLQIYDRGTVSITINGVLNQVSYGRFDTSSSVASNLVSAINSGGASGLVSASTPSGGATITIIARAAGFVGNSITLSASSVSNDPADFPPDGSFPPAASGTSLSGGSDTGTIVDFGNVTLSVGGFTTPNVPYNSTTTASAVAQNLANGVAASGSATATSSGTVITVTYNTVGSAGNGLAVTTNPISGDPGDFPSPSFSVGSTTLSGGAGPYSSGLTHPFTTTYTYDVFDNLVAVSQASGLVNGIPAAGQPRSYVYDDLSRLTSLTTPEAGTVTYFYTTSTGSACSGDPKLICRATDARNVTRTYSYDSINRLVGVSYSDGTPATTFTYDTGGAAAFALDRLTKITEGSNSQTFTYDNRGRVKSVAHLISGATRTVKYAYNAANQVASITYPSNRVVTQNYDAVGRPLSFVSGTTTYLTVNTFNAAMQPTVITYGNTVQGTFGYNDHLQLATLRYFKSGSSTDLLNLSYDYINGVPGNNGQIQAVHFFTSPGVEDQTKTEYFSYDPWMRLSSAHSGVVNSTAGTWSLSWTHDRFGNRLSQHLDGGNVTIGGPQFTVDPNTNRITNAGITYDAAGNETSDGTKIYAYDGASRLKTVNNTAAAYTYFGPLRIQKVVGSTTTAYIYSGTKPIAEYVNGALSKEFIYTGSSLLATSSGSTVTYHHPDHLSNRVETNSSGTSVRTYGHFPFGETWYETGAADKWKFTSYERDTESPLDYAQFRYYGSLQGRFVAADLLRGRPETPQSLNSYGYGLNDPVSGIDPLGLKPRRALKADADGILGDGSENTAQCLDEGGSLESCGGNAFGLFLCYADGSLMDCGVVQQLSPEAIIKCPETGCEPIGYRADGRFFLLQFGVDGYTDLFTRDKVQEINGTLYDITEPAKWLVGNLGIVMSRAEKAVRDAIAKGNTVVPTQNGNINLLFNAPYLQIQR